LLEYKPDIFFTALSPLNLKFLDLTVLKKAKLTGTKVFVNIPFWKSPFSKLRINETASLEKNNNYIELLKSTDYGDIYYNSCEQNDKRMDGFEEVVRKKYHTVLLAADKTLIFPEKDNKFKADISYIGTNLPEKRYFFNEVIKPLKKKFNVKIYGQDWTLFDNTLGYIQKFGQYFNLAYLENIRKPKLKLSDERKIYNTSIISINIHEEYQKKYGDLNERTFKIPLAGGFEIIDDVSSLKKYFDVGKEIIVAYDKDDWHQKISYYVKNPKEREKIIKAGKKRILEEHTYHNRVAQFLKIYQSLI